MIAEGVRVGHLVLISRVRLVVASRIDRCFSIADVDGFITGSTESVLLIEVWLLLMLLFG